MSNTLLKKIVVTSAIIVTVFGLSACGRKGDLEAPPSASLASPLFPSQNV